jgi:hypothetical protein
MIYSGPYASPEMSEAPATVQKPILSFAGETTMRSIWLCQSSGCGDMREPHRGARISRPYVRLCLLASALFYSKPIGIRNTATVKAILANRGNKAENLEGSDRVAMRRSLAPI